MLTLASALISSGVTVKLVCLRADDQVKQAFKDAVIELEGASNKGVVEAEHYCASYLREMISASADRRPFDLIVSGGWPFFSAAVVGQHHKIATVFIDAGAVPHTGLAGSAKTIQTTLRRIRSLTLPVFTRVLPISSFIRNSQTLVDREHASGVETVYLGTDHLQQGVFASSDPASEQLVLERLRNLKASGTGLVLNLGRFEAQGYKNSLAALRVIRKVRSRHRKTHLIVLEDETELVRTIGSHRLDGVEAIGKLSDSSLVEVMEIADAGLSVSLWEGFNLPAGEMQRLGKPVVAFNVGAHAEVIAHPWCLALSERELAGKLADIVAGEIPSDVKTAVQDWRNKKEFTWSAATATYIGIVDDILAGRETEPNPADRPSVLVDVTNAGIDEANSGVMRVTRRLLAELLKLDEIDLVFVRWNHETQSYELPTKPHARILALYGGPEDPLTDVTEKLGNRSLGVLELDLLTASWPETVLFMPEIALDGSAERRVDWATVRNIKVSAILYDLIPVTHPELCDSEIVKHFPNYVSALLQADRITSISKASLSEFKKYCARENLQTPASLKSVWLPGQFSDHQRVLNAKPCSPDTVTHEIVYVSTIEPRKNHMRVIQAFKELRDRPEYKNLKLVLIGNSYAGRSEYGERFVSEITNEPSIEWKRVVPDEEIAAAISRARFTVYGSIVEGFGLPVLESLWLGKPCICHCDGVMKELADAGGCLTVDMESVPAIVDGFDRLLTDDELYKRLCDEASARTIATWSEYSRQVCFAAFGKKPDNLQHMSDQHNQSLENEIATYSAALARRVGAVAEFGQNTHLSTGDTRRPVLSFGSVAALNRLSLRLLRQNPIKQLSIAVNKLVSKIGLGKI